jgi:hypothetical protein
MLIILGAALVVCFAPAYAQERFKTTDDAVTALVDAAKSQDKKQLLTVLGPKGQQIVSSGDPVADQMAHDKFVTAYDAKHTVTQDGDDKATPFPIPMVRKPDGWRFDTRAGLDEILRRRIGRDELSAIQVSLAYVQAQNEYALLKDGLGQHVYAQHIVSSPGKKDGLYWPTAEREEPSPLGDLAAQASAEGYTRSARGRSPITAISTAS